MAILTCKGLSKRFGGTQALDQVDLSVEPGRIVGLLGPNGSGKTTLIKLANGLLTPSEGELRVCGLLPGKESHACVSYLPERTAIPTWMSVTQLLDFYQDFYADFRRDVLGDVDLLVLDHEDLVRVPQSQIEIMECDDHTAVAGMDYLLHRLHRIYLMPQVQRARRFIEHVETWPL